MRSGRGRAAIVAVLFGAAAAACGLFPDLSGLTEDASTGADAPLADVANESSADAPNEAALDGGSSDGDAEAASPACPSGRGPTMVKLDPHTCIDTTEVTVAQYRAFFTAIDGGAFPQPPECAFNGNNFTPGSGMPGTAKNAYPIANLNWCQAYAFCAWAGKSLCGTFDGGAVPFVSFTNSAQDVWMNACSANGAQSYPYGPAFEAGACNIASADANAPAAPVATFPKCEGSLPGLFDMVGNIKEWENSCVSAGTGDAGADQCRRRGSGFDEPGTGTLETCAWDETDTRDHQSFTSGVRCCAILP